MQIEPGQLIRYIWGQKPFYVVTEVKGNVVKVYNIQNGISSRIELFFLYSNFQFLYSNFQFL